MASNVYPCRPAAQISWCERFTNATTLAANGGTLVGAPTVKNGIHLNGVDQYASFAMSGGDFAGDPVSIVCEFTPDFAVDEPVLRTIFSSTDGDGYSVFKRADGRIGLSLGDSGIGIAAAAVVAPLWRNNQKNTIVVSGAFTHTDMYLNGVLILDDDGEVWYPLASTTLYVGCDNVAADFFRGTVHSLDFRQTRLKQDDATFLFNRGIGGPWRYRTDSLVWLDTKTIDQDIDGLWHTKGANARGRDFLILEGAAAVNAPRYHCPGYYCDVAKGNGYLRHVDEIKNHAREGLTFTMAFQADFEPTNNTVRTFWGTDGAAHLALKLDNGDNDVLRFYIGGDAVGLVTLADYAPVWKTSGLNVLTLAASSEDTCVYLNGKHLVKHDSTVLDTSVIGSCYVGATPTAAYGITGMIWHFSILPYKALPMQVADILDLMRSLY